MTNFFYTLIMWANIGFGITIIAVRHDVSRFAGIIPIAFGIYMGVKRTMQAYKTAKKERDNKHD